MAAGLPRRPPLKTESEILEYSLAMGVSPYEVMYEFNVVKPHGRLVPVS
jgi:hypothetical protein